MRTVRLRLPRVFPLLRVSARAIVTAFVLVAHCLTGCEEPAVAEGPHDVAPRSRWEVAPGASGSFELGPLRIGVPTDHAGVEWSDGVLVVQPSEGACAIRWIHAAEGVPAPIGVWVMARAARLESVPMLQLESSEPRRFGALDGRVWQMWTTGPVSETAGRRGVSVVGVETEPGVAFAFTGYFEAERDRCRDRLLAHAATAQRAE
jgi:hypothetical protein